MSRRNSRPLADRVTEAAEAVLAAQDYVSIVDVFLGIRWLDPSAVKQWRLGRIDCIEEAIQTNPVRLAEAMELFHAWAAGRDLLPREAEYVARTPQRQGLRFGRSGDAAVEQAYRTHWLSPALSDKKRERLTEKASRAPELVVIQPRNHDWTCHRCGGGGDFLMMENPGPACLRCVGLDDLEFLGSGDALLTRRARAKSARHAVVVRFSRSRRRYERLGLLVEPAALREAERSVEETRV